MLANFHNLRDLHNLHVVKAHSAVVELSAKVAGSFVIVGGLVVAAIVLALCLFTGFFLCVKHLVPPTRGLPADAFPVPEEEEKQLLSEMEGEWTVISGGSTCCDDEEEEGLIQQNRFKVNVSFTRASVRGDTMTFSGGLSKRGLPLTDRQAKLKFSRTASGFLYCDELGSKISNWAPHEGNIEINNSMGIDIVLQRVSEI